MNKLREWLDRHGARRLWEAGVGRKARVCAYALRGGAVVLVHYYGRDADAENAEGWQLYVPPDQDNKIATTLDAAERLLGLEPKPAAHQGERKPCPHCGEDLNHPSQLLHVRPHECWRR